MPGKARIKYRSLRSNLVHLPLSLYSSLAQQQVRPQGIILHISPSSHSSSGSSSRVPREAYLGWSGLSSASSLGGGIAGLGNVDISDILEVDPEVAIDLGWTEGQIVDISIIHRPTKARTVSVTPVSPDDWEILDLHASYLENNLLSQLRAVQIGQEVNVWVKGQNKIRIRIDSTSPSSTAKEAVLITPDTEIIVAPRTRGQAQEDGPRIIEPHGSESQSSKSGNAQRRIPAVRARLMPGRVAASWGESEFPPNYKTSGNEVLGLCSSDTLEHARHKLKFSVSDIIAVKAEIITFESGTEPRSPKDDAAGSVDENKESGLDLVLIAWDEMPDGHLTITGRLGDEWKSWSSVHLTRTAVKPSRKHLKANGERSATLPYPEKPYNLVGVDEQVEEGTEYLRRCAAIGTSRPLLITSPKGGGKTSISKRISSILESDREILSELIYIDVRKLDSERRASEIRETMRNWVEEAKRRIPSLLILDNLDSLLSPETELQTTTSTTVGALADMFCRLFSPSNLPAGVLVICTAINLDSLHPLLRRKHIFGEHVHLSFPDKAARQELLRHFLHHLIPAQQGQGNQKDEEEIDLVDVAGQSDGYAAADLKTLVELAYNQAIIRSTKADDTNVQLSQDDFDEALRSFTPQSLKGVKLQKSTVQWSDIGGLHEPRRVIRETLEWPTKYAQIFKNCPLRLRSGLLLYGYPGCGKTLLASAAAKECGLNFISVKGPEVLNKYIGASEKAIRDVFERASSAKPCVLFFDEFESIAPKRGHDSTGVTDRVVNQMLTEMDGAQGLEGVYVLAATSRPDLIDPALLRPGRLDKSILCDMPSMRERLEILAAVSRKLNLATNVDLEAIAIDTEGFSGADLQALVYNAHLEVVQSSISTVPISDRSDDLKSKGKGKGKALANGHPVQPKRRWKQIAPQGDLPEDTDLDQRLDALCKDLSLDSKTKENKSTVRIPVVEQHHLLRSLETTRPSVTSAEMARYSRIYRGFLADRDGSMADGDFGRDTGTRMSLM